MLDGVIASNARGIIQWANPAACEQFGYAENEMIGNNLTMLMPEPYASHHDEYLRNYQESRIPKVIGTGREVVGLRKNGQQFPMALSVTAFNLDGEEFYCGVVADLTEQKRQEEANRMLEQQLQLAHKMEALGQLAGGIAHDLNNLLTPIIGFAELSQLTEDIKPELNGNLEIILSAANRARDIVKQILTFCRKSEVPHQRIRVQTLIKDVESLLRAATPADIKLVIQNLIEDENATICGDSTQIYQVLMNLCCNATHAMDNSVGALTFRLSQQTSHPEAIANDQTIQQNPFLLIEVSDTGCGIPPEVLPRVFEPFFTTKPKNQGTGMGLAVCHGIVRTHGGTITIDSKPGQGTTVNVYLPLLPDGSDHSTEITAPPAILTGMGHIALVDDEPMILAFCQKSLSKLGYCTKAFVSANEALNYIATSPTTVDLLVSDVSMPEMSGNELAAKAKQLHPSLAIILMSGWCDEQTQLSIESSGIAEFVLKPVSFSTLSESVSRVMQKTKRND